MRTRKSVVRILLALATAFAPVNGTPSAITRSPLPAATSSASPTAPAAATESAAAGTVLWPIAAPSRASGFALPLPPPPLLLTPFDPPTERWGSGHRGVDLAGHSGAPVLAAGNGVVAFAGMVAGRPVVSVKHTDMLRTTYEPVDPQVSAGQRVRTGQPLGVLIAGHPSCIPATCLHWGARVGDDHYLDPFRLLAGLQVRLKPWDG